MKIVTLLVQLFHFLIHQMNVAASCNSACLSAAQGIPDANNMHTIIFAYSDHELNQRASDS